MRLERTERINTEGTEDAEFTERERARKYEEASTTLEFNESCGITRWRVPAGGARIHSARRGHRRGGRAFLPSPRLADGASSRCGDRLRGFAGNCRCGFFRSGRRF